MRLYQKVQGNVSDVREGALQIGSAGIGVVGRALPRAEIMQTILIFGVLINLFIALLAFLIMRYGCMQPYNVFINWNEITEIIIDKQRKRFGLSYNGLNYKGKAMQFSICTRASTADIDLFEQYAVANAPTITHAGRLRSATSIVAWVVLAFIVAGFAFGFLYVAFGHH